MTRKSQNQLERLLKAIEYAGKLIEGAP